MNGYDYKYSVTGVLAALLACLLLSSCNDVLLDSKDAPVEDRDDISFGIGWEEDTYGTKAGAGEEYADAYFVLRSAGTDDTLCVHAFVTEGIGGSSFGSPVQTKAAPVMSLETYGAFRVQVHCTDNGVAIEEFYMDETVDNLDSGIWSTSRVYYWPGEERTLRFFAWAPVDAEFASVPLTPESTQLAYTVPEDVAAQKDIVVAVTDAMPGNSNTTVPLDFKHICTAVRFEIGRQMQPGSIDSVALVGVRNSGTYDMAAGRWTLDESAEGDFFQFIGNATTGGEADGAEITTADGTFMMLPQTLPSGAKVRVAFTDGITGEKRALEADIAGMEWPQGRTVTYKLSITPDYKLEFVSTPVAQDAHYVRYDIEINAGELPNGWTLESTSPDVTLCTELQTFTSRGFWVEEEAGEQTITRTTVGDNIKVYVFLKENAGTEAREVDLLLYPTGDKSSPRVFTITQLCPNWGDTFGCERIEEGDYPWGFSWPENLVITYDFGFAWENLGYKAITFFYINLFTDYPWVEQDMSILHYAVEFHFDKISSQVATSEDDGWQNTWDLFNFEGLNDASSMMEMFETWGIEPDVTLPTNPTEFAARACALKNKFTIVTGTQDGQEVKRAVLLQEDMKWYLPARAQAPLVQDAEYPLSGEYWTSTAYEADNTHAYKFSPGASPQTELREKVLNVRAVRVKDF